MAQFNPAGSQYAFPQFTTGPLSTGNTWLVLNQGGTNGYNLNGTNALRFLNEITPSAYKLVTIDQMNTASNSLVVQIGAAGGLSFTPQFGSANLTNWATLDTNILSGLGGGSSAWADITGKPTTIAGYGITDYNSLGDARWQPLDAELTAWAALATSAKQDADADLTDLADGSLTGSKVGTGINGDNITSGTVADARIDTALTRTTQLNAASNAIVAQIAEAGGGDVTTAQLNSASNVLWQAKVDSTNSTRLATQLALASTYQPLDADLTDLADGSLTGSKVGSGISGDNVTTGTVADARVASTIARDSEVTAAVAITASGFNGNLTTTDDTIQELAQAVDDLVLGGSSDYDTNTFTGTGPLVRATNAVLHTPTFTGGVTANVLNVPLLRSTTAGNTNVIAAWGANGNSTNVQVGASLSYDAPTRTLAVALDASGFNGNLATTDDTVQEVAQKLDDLSVGGSGGIISHRIDFDAGATSRALTANSTNYFLLGSYNGAPTANNSRTAAYHYSYATNLVICWFASGAQIFSATNLPFRLLTNGVDTLGSGFQSIVTGDGSFSQRIQVISSGSLSMVGVTNINLIGVTTNAMAGVINGYIELVK